MAEHKLAILVSAVGAAKASKELKGLDASLSRLGANAGKGLRTAAGNLAKIGAVAAAGIGLAVKTGLDNLAELESAITSVDGAIAQMGLTGQLSGKQIADWAAVIEDNTGAAFDEKPITLATGSLIRYGKVTTSNLRPAMAVMVDLAAKTGDIESAATLLAKALADPEKAAGKLARQGVILTKGQQAQIKAMMKAGDVAGAQKVILDSLATTTRGAALASQGPYKRAMSMLADATEHATMALAEGFLPVITRASEWLRTKLADPKVMADIRSFGQSLAGSFDKALTFAQSINWDSVRSAASAIGTGAKVALDAFLAMPTWVQTAVVGGWGLNKLTGGALGDIAGELAKGMIKGVLGINAGVVNVNGGVVNSGGLPGKGGGGIPGLPGAGAAAGILGPGLGMAIAGIAAPIVAFQIVPRLWNEIMGVKPNTVNPETAPINTGHGGSITGTNAGIVRFFTPALRQLEGIKTNTSAALGVTRNLRQTTEGVRAAALATSSSIDRKRWDVNVYPRIIVNNKVSVRELRVGIATTASYAGGYGSR